jgi:dipeptidase E
VKLVLYSGGQQRSNQELHQELMNLTGKRRKISLTYVPFCADNAEIYFRRISKRFQRFGASRFQCLPLDLPQAPTPDEIKRAFSSDVVYLAGGNTFYFLHWIRKRKLLGALRNYVKEGGVLAGLSAGAHMMTPHIGLAGLKGLDPDDNEVGLKSLGALGLVEFEFMPHFYESRHSVKIMRKYSEKSGTTIYGCADGGGIVIHGHLFSVLGRCWVFHDGDWLKLT